MYDPIGKTPNLFKNHINDFYFVFGVTCKMTRNGVRSVCVLAPFMDIYKDRVFSADTHTGNQCFFA